MTDFKLKRVTIVKDKAQGWSPDENGRLCFYEEANAEIERLRALNAELVASFNSQLVQGARTDEREARLRAEMERIRDLSPEGGTHPADALVLIRYGYDQARKIAGGCLAGLADTASGSDVK